MKLFFLKYISLLSLFNFLYIKVWIETSIINPKNFFYIGGVPQKFLLYNFFSFIIFFTIFFFFLKLSEKFKFIENFTKLILIIEISYILKTFFPYKYLSIFIFFILIIFFTFIFIKFDFKKNLKFLGIVFLPFFFLTIYNLSILTFFLNPITQEQFSTSKKNKISSSSEKKKLVVWIVFDALSMEKIYGNKNLKNFNRMMQTSDIYTNYKVNINDTGHSIPSMILGRDVRKIQTIYQDKKISRNFFDEQGKFITINFDNSIFDQINEKGKSIYINGWYYPYCNMVRVYNECFSNLYSWDLYYSYNFNFLLIFNLYKMVPFRDFFLKKYKNIFHVENFGFKEAVKSHKFSLEHFLNALDNKFQFYFYHSSYPHRPYIFDSKKNSYKENYFDKSSYEDNIFMTDLALGKIIKTLKSKNNFEDALIIISSDHPVVDDKNIFNNYKKPVLIIKNRNQINKKVIEKQIYNFDLKNIVLKNISNSN